MQGGGRWAGGRGGMGGRCKVFCAFIKKKEKRGNEVLRASSKGLSMVSVVRSG